MEERALMMLLKAFKEENLANEFLDGCLYCNTLSFHRQQDNHEGTIVIPGSNIRRFKIGTYKLKTVRNFSYRPNLTDYINIFCMYSWAPPFEDDSKKRVILNKAEQLGSLRTLEDTYGPHAVVIRDIPEFLERLTIAIKRAENQVYRVKGSVVKYELMGRIPRDNIDEMIQLAFAKTQSTQTRKNIGCICPR